MNDNLVDPIGVYAAIGALIGACIYAACCGGFARSKGYSFWLWAGACLVFGPFAVIPLALLPKKERVTPNG